MNGPETLSHRPAGRRLGPAAVLFAAALLLGLVWSGTATAIHAERAHDVAGWMRIAVGFAVAMTALIPAMTVAVLRSLAASAERERSVARERSMLAQANAGLERARAHAAASTAELQATIAGMSDGVVMIDNKLRLGQWNARYPELSGVPPDLLRVGVPVADILRAQAQLGHFGTTDPDAEVSRRIAQMRPGALTGPARLERVRPDGRVIELRRAPLPDGGSVTLYSDITARKQSEAAMQQARALAEAATEAKSRFVAIVSHEIRTPLNTLLNSLRMLSDTPLSYDQRRMADLARDAGGALMALLNDVLEMSRMDAGRLLLRPARFALRPLLAAVLDMFRAEATARRIVLRVDVAADVPTMLTTDPGRLRQVLINLVSNAVKFSDPGPVRLRAVREDLGRLRITVEGRGPPIGAQDRARLFLPFSQLEQSAAAGAPGSGLGLAICHRLVTLLNGEIGCDPTPAGGNAFWIDLPVDEGQAAEAPLGTPARAATASPRTRVLLADDVPPSRMLMATVLRRAGHHVDVAATGEDAVRMAARGCYDLVFMDLFMPGIGGIEAVRRIRAQGGWLSRLPILALTANVSDEDRARCEAAGMDGALGKPIEPETLFAAIAEHVWSGRLGRTIAARRPMTARSPGDILCADRLASLRHNLSPAVFAGLAEECIGELTQRMGRLEPALETGCLDTIEEQAHAMAGLAGTFGLERLERGLRGLPALARDGGSDRRVAAAPMLATDLDDAARALREAVAPAPA